MVMTLSSRSIEPGERIPTDYTCDGKNVSPPFEWSGAPQGTRSFALACVDPDAPSGIFHHWMAYDIPASSNGMSEAQAKIASAAGFRQAINDFRKAGYGGPCPPRGHGIHHYHFRLYALSSAELPVEPDATCAEAIATAARLVLETAELVGLYSR